MGKRLLTQLQTLGRELERLEELLMLDANWRALREFDEVEVEGEPVEASDGGSIRKSLIAALSGNRLFAARAKLRDTIELLSCAPPDDEVAGPRATGALAGVQSLSSRIVLLTLPGTDSFRARVRMKVAAPSAVQQPSGDTPSGLPAVMNEAPGGTPQHQVVDRGSSLSVPSVPGALELIDGLSRCAVETLQSHGVNSFSDIARWTSADTAVWRVRLEGIAEGQPSSWIEQAAMLASGIDTHHAARVRRGEFASLVPAPTLEPMLPRLLRVILPGPGVKHLVEAIPAKTIPGEASAAPRAGSSPRRVSAAELAKVLATSVLVAPTDALTAAANPVSARLRSRPHGMSQLSKLSSSRRGLNRAAAQIEDVTDDSEAGDSDVLVISRAPTSNNEPVPAANGDVAPPASGLLRRLKQIERQRNFRADGYAAYRGEVEEASVTIIQAKNEPMFSGRQVAQPLVEEKGSVNRFLRALTGRG